eukprot:TRINITY_DN3023_c0_g1_i1.p3 TRINITY_DN3023_c0_g1~~TRINITY_DN3023_c0_g1_i1.p3  ORF type:complete len:114 (+),score=4.15 TRINITY_DN3023_c0_g1_i1:46-387(+)
MRLSIWTGLLPVLFTLSVVSGDVLSCIREKKCFELAADLEISACVKACKADNLFWKRQYTMEHFRWGKPKEEKKKKKKGGSTNEVIDFDNEYENNFMQDFEPQLEEHWAGLQS